MKYKKEFKEAHPETLGETDSAFDMSNYIDWLDKRVEKLERGLIAVKGMCDGNITSENNIWHIANNTLKN